MTVVTPDFDKMSLEELRQHAEAELAKANEQPQSAPTEQPRDESGRFTKEDDQPQTPPTETVKFRRVIDLGDGSGTEVFEADTLEELVDKIADAKLNATKKIRSQESELKTLRTKQQEQQNQATADEEFVYSQELLAKPTEAFKKLFKQTTGVDISEFKTVYDRSQALIAASEKTEAQKRLDQIALDFKTSHPRYVDNERNGHKISKWLTLHNDFSLEGFNKAYDDLSESGLLELQSEEANARQEEPKQTTERIVPSPAAVTPSQRTKKASGLSTQNRPSAPPTSTTPSEDDAYTMPLEQLKALANKQLAGR